MTLRKKKALVQRYKGNPILTADDFPGDVSSVFNSTVMKLAKNRYVMICRVEDSAMGRYLWTADSKDGIRFKPRPKPLSMPVDDPDFMEYCGDTKTYYDPRMVCLDGKYYITHAAHTSHQCALGLFEIDKDFDRLTWKGLIMPPDNRNGVLFPEKINGKYWLLHRPNVGGNMDIWISESQDLTHWGGHRCLIPKKTVYWADAKIGGGAVPIKTPQGWLCIIHGVRIQCTDYVYSLGVALLDLKDPRKVLGVSKRAILDPQEIWEHVGQAPFVVFTTGAVVEDDGTVRIYYGGADKVMALAEGKLQDLIDSCLHENVF